ncbi:uncharacterized protein PG998_013960 [Apiospora kogelbergensis]|uniref:uncharacterized protein n=1 Tax=Apiospora kogelbergensis TaxID=1337665 RepID=UPI0031302E73
MAFHQPTHQPIPRPYHSVDEDDTQQASQGIPQAVEDSQTWVLFSPETDAGTTTSYLTTTHQTKSTPGRSRLSDLGSIHSAVRSQNSTDQHHSASLIDDLDVDEEEDEDEDEDAELDSLDSHLPEFRSVPNVTNHHTDGVAHSTPVLPAHDGLGSFRVDQEGIGLDMQDRLYAFEQYNPRRVKRRRESQELAQAELMGEECDVEKMQRIESWRLEHSRFLLEEIQKETRRRRSVASTLNAQQERRNTEEALVSEAITMDEVDPGEAWHDQHASVLVSEPEGLWSRITRKVIRDLLGIDDKLLSTLFGDSLPDEDDLNSMPRVSSVPQNATGDISSSNLADSVWQIRLLERIARELGSFVHQLSEHPGAFSTFARVQQMPIPYAGLPPIPETANDASQASMVREASAVLPEFKPTLAQQPQPMNTPQAQAAVSKSHGAPLLQGDNTASTTFTKEEWEQDLDIRLVFRYLRSRFLSRPSSSGGVSGSSHLATSNTADAAAKVARVRQHHPLVSRTRPTERRSFRATTPTSPVHYRHASSCASQSTRRSVRKSSCSSRHYWDLGAGSVGTGSLIAAAGPMGSWGEI